MTKLKKLIEAANLIVKQQGEWISVKDRLPNDQEEILLIWKGSIYPGKFRGPRKYTGHNCFIFWAPHSNEWKRHTVYYPEGVDPIYYWMKLPEPPEKVAKQKGMVLLPEEPTEEMNRAGAEECVRYFGQACPNYIAESIFKAIIAKAKEE